jgi:hypothetical protein
VAGAFKSGFDVLEGCVSLCPVLALDLLLGFFHFLLSIILFLRSLFIFDVHHLRSEIVLF